MYSILYVRKLVGSVTIITVRVGLIFCSVVWEKPMAEQKRIVFFSPTPNLT